MGDGNDIIQNIKTNDLIHITSGSYTTQISDNDLIVQVGNGKLTLKDAAYRKLQIKNASGSIDTINRYGTVYVRNGLSNRSIIGSGENDTIRNYGSNVTISTFSADDNILNDYQASLTAIYADYGDDYIQNSAWQVTINGGNGNDTLDNWGNASLSALNAGSGNDHISNRASQVTINAGDDDDYIYDDSSGNVTINAGSGYDTINLSSYRSGNNVIQFAEGDDYDIVQGLKTNDLIHITSGNYTASTYGNNLYINIGYEGLMIKDGANRRLSVKNSNGKIDILNPNGIVFVGNNDSNTNIIGSNYNDTIYNEASEVTINSGAGDDYISNHYNTSQTEIISGDGNDIIYNNGSQTNINSGNDNDTISNYGHNVLINAGNGNDAIENFGNNITISTSKGNDTINIYPSWRGSYEYAYSCDNIFQYANGDGNDVIKNVASNDLIHITNGSYTTKISDNDLLINVGNGSITLKDAANRKLQIKNANGEIETINSNGILFIRNNQSSININGSNYNDTIANAATNVKIYAGSGSDTIYNDYGASLSAIYAASGDNRINNSASQVTIESGGGKDTIDNTASEVTIKSGEGDDYILNGEEHVGSSIALIDSGAGDDTIYNYEATQVTINAGSGNDSIRNSGFNSVGDITINGGKGNDTIINNDRYTAIEIIEYSIGDGDDIVENYGTEDKIKLLSGSIRKAELNGDDVVITIDDGSITLKEAKGKQVTVIDPNNKTIQFTDGYKDSDNTTNKDKDIILNINIDNKDITLLKLFSNFYKDSGLEWALKNDVKLMDFLSSDVGSILKFAADIYKLKNFGKKNIPPVDSFLKMVANVLKIADDTLNLINDIADNGTKDDANKKNIPDFVDDTLQIVSQITDFIGNYDKYHGSSKILLPVAAAAVAVVGNCIPVICKKIGGENFKDIDVEDLQKNSIKLFSKAAISALGSSASEAAPFGPIAILTSVCTGLVCGYWQYQESIDKYKNDGLPSSLALKTAITDTIVTIVHDSVSTYTQGADDAVFDMAKKVITVLQSLFMEVNINEGLDEKNYLEILGDVFKKLDFSEVGTKKDDDIISSKDGDKPIYSDDGNDHILIKHSNLQIYSGRGNDTVFSIDNTYNNYVYAGNDNDYLVSAGKGHTMHGGNGDDRIVVQGIAINSKSDGHYIYGDAGKDYIILSDKATNNVIRGGLDDDVINLASSKDNLIVYSTGDGTDTIYCYEESNKIRIQSNDNVSTLTNADSEDITIKVGLDNAMIIADGKDKKINITKVERVSEEDIISAIKLKNKFVDNFKLRSGGYLSNNGEISSSKQNNSIAQIEQTSNLIVYSALKASAQEFSFGNTDDEKDWLITTSDGNDNITSSAVSDSTINSGAGDDTIKVDSFGIASVNAGVGNDYINVTGMGRSIINAGKGNDTVNASILRSTTAYAERNSSENQSSEINRGSMIFQYAEGDGNDIIYGYNSTDTIQISGNSYTTTTSGSDIIVNVGNESANNGKITLSGATSLSTVNIIDSTTQSVGSDDYTINKAKTAVTLGSGFKGTFDLADLAKVKTVVGSQVSNDVEIIGNDKVNKLIGGSGKDTLNGGKGKDTLTGNDGADVFVYESGSGKDVITDYTADEDSIVITGDYVSASSVKGSDVILKAGKGTLTVKNGKSKELTVIDKLGTHTRVYDNDMFITDSDKAKVKAKSKVIMMDASNRTAAINIKGSSKANTILGGSGANTINGGNGNDYLAGGDNNDKLLGGAGADTLISSGGNDTLTGGAGRDVFVYESGNDVITDYKAGQDSIMIEDEIESVSVKGSNVIFTISDGTLTVKGGKNKRITFIDSEGEVISNDKYTKSTKTANFIEDDYWFANDDNFVTTDMDSIIEVDDNGYSIGKLDYSIDNVQLTNDNETSITYTENKNKN
ncbi:MAG: hypothetical protein IJ563_02915 [Selenomonadaceae bacterium]|nr:hypothetical protein [Selenomonadaceae bacterium]